MVGRNDGSINAGLKEIIQIIQAFAQVSRPPEDAAQQHAAGGDGEEGAGHEDERSTG